MRSLIIFTCCLLITTAGVAQTRVIHGVLTAYNKYPVANIEVKAKKSKSSTKSDTLGNFSIVCNEKDQISIKPETFKTTSRKIDKYTPDTLTINLVFMEGSSVDSSRHWGKRYSLTPRERIQKAREEFDEKNIDGTQYLYIATDYPLDIC